MPYKIDELGGSQRCIDGKYYIARPEPVKGIPGLLWRVKEALLVLIGKADAITFYRQ